MVTLQSFLVILMLLAPFLGACLVFLAPKVADLFARAEGTTVPTAAAFTSLLPPALVVLSALGLATSLRGGEVFEMPLMPRWAGGGLVAVLGTARLAYLAMLAAVGLAANVWALCRGHLDPPTYASLLVIEGGAGAYALHQSLWPLLLASMVAALAFLAASRAGRAPRGRP